MKTHENPRLQPSTVSREGGWVAGLGSTARTIHRARCLPPRLLSTVILNAGAERSKKVLAGLCYTGKGALQCHGDKTLSMNYCYQLVQYTLLSCLYSCCSLSAIAGRWECRDRHDHVVGPPLVSGDPAEAQLLRREAGDGSVVRAGAAGFPLTGVPCCLTPQPSWGPFLLPSSFS